MQNEADSPISLTSAGIVISRPEEIPGLKSHFAQNNWVKLPGLLSGDLLDRVLAGIDKGDFFDRVHEEIGPNKEKCLADNIVTSLMHFLVNNQTFFSVVQVLTNCGLIGSFSGRVYQFLPQPDYHDAWHSDSTDGRLLALSINLSREPYTGGVLQLRGAGKSNVDAEITNPHPGDAILFRITDSLEHRVTPVAGDAPRTAYAGWFFSEHTTLLDQVRLATGKNRNLKS